MESPLEERHHDFLGGVELTLEDATDGPGSRTHAGRREVLRKKAAEGVAGSMDAWMSDSLRMSWVTFALLERVPMREVSTSEPLSQ